MVEDSKEEKNNEQKVEVNLVRDEERSSESSKNINDEGNVDDSEKTSNENSPEVSTNEFSPSGSFVPRLSRSSAQDVKPFLESSGPVLNLESGFNNSGARTSNPNMSGRDNSTLNTPQYSNISNYQTNAPNYNYTPPRAISDARVQQMRDNLTLTPSFSPTTPLIRRQSPQQSEDGYPNNESKLSNFIEKDYEINLRDTSSSRRRRG
jgi:hypothetical protein